MRGVLLALVVVACGAAKPPPPETDDLDTDEAMVEQARVIAAPAPADAGTPAIHVAVVASDAGVTEATGARIDLDVRDADVADVLRMIAAAAKISIVVPDDAKGKVTLDIRNVTWRQAIDVIAQLERLTVKEEDGIVVVMPAP